MSGRPVTGTVAIGLYDISKEILTLLNLPLELHEDGDRNAVYAYQALGGKLVEIGVFETVETNDKVGLEFCVRNLRLTLPALFDVCGKIDLGSHRPSIEEVPFTIVPTTIQRRADGPHTEGKQTMTTTVKPGNDYTVMLLAYVKEKGDLWTSGGLVGEGPFLKVHEQELALKVLDGPPFLMVLWGEEGSGQGDGEVKRLGPRGIHIDKDSELWKACEGA